MMTKAIATHLVLCVSTCFGGTVYRFVDRDSGSVLAYLELGELPAQNDDVLSLRFTDAGSTMFGYGEFYSGTFDYMSWEDSEFLEDPFMPSGLSGSDSFGSAFSFMVDGDPPASTVLTGSLKRFDLHASAYENDDFIRLIDESDNRVERPGTWQLVPEPMGTSTAFALFFFAMCGLRSQWRNL